MAHDQRLEATTSPRLRTLATQWAERALAPLRGAVAAAMPMANAYETCEILIDLLDGAANRLRLIEAIPGTVEDVFSARWDLFVSTPIRNRLRSTGKRAGNG